MSVMLIVPEVVEETPCNIYNCRLEIFSMRSPVRKPRPAPKRAPSRLAFPVVRNIGAGDTC